jgi:hypothetical protein
MQIPLGSGAYYELTILDFLIACVSSAFYILGIILSSLIGIGLLTLVGIVLNTIARWLGSPPIRRVFRLKNSRDVLSQKCIGDWAVIFLMLICVPATVYEINAPSRISMFGEDGGIPSYLVFYIVTTSKGLLEGVLAFSMLCGIALLVPPVSDNDLSRNERPFQHLE